MFAAVLVVFCASTVGVAGALLGISLDLTPSSNPPSISVSFPNNGGSYNAAGWVNGCSPGGICGSASDKNGVAAVTVAVRQQSTGKYWNGTAFTSPTALYNSATGTTSWRYPLHLPPDGAYTAYVRATDGLGNATPIASPVNVGFTIDTVAPPAPTLLDSPGIVTALLDAVFHLIDLDGTVHFQCQLDGQAVQSCGPTLTYLHLAIGDHCIRVFAVDGALNVSAAVSFCWSIGTTAFTVNGDMPQLSYPGVVQPVDLVITNPFLFPLTVSAVNTTIQDVTTNAACLGNQNFRVAQAFQGPVDVPARSTRSLSQLGVPVNRWPRIEMINLPTSQNGCKGAKFRMTYTGLGEKHL